jgi:multiple sugar transport system substrate-binding protein
MNKTMKSVIAALGAASMLFGLGACGSSSSSDSSSSKTTTISFQTWNLKNDTYTPYFNKLVKQFEKQNPGVKVKWIDQPAENYDAKLSTDAAANHLPDVVNVNEQQSYNLAKAGALLNLSKEAPELAKDYVPGVWKGGKFKGNGIEEGVYGVPWYMNIDVAYLNKNVFQQCGLDVANPPKTYDDLFSQARKLASNSSCTGKDYMLAVPLVAPSDFAEYGVKFMNADHSKYTFNSAKGVEFITQIADLYKMKAYPEDGLNTNIVNAEKLYFQGNIAYMKDSTSSVMAFKQNAPDLYKQLDVAPLATNTTNTLNPMTFGVSSQTKNKKMAIKLANFLTNKKNQVEFSKKSNTFPSAAGAMDDPYFQKLDANTLEGKVMKVAKQEIDNGSVSNFVPEVSESDGASYLSPEIVKAIKGEQTPKQALDKAVAALNDRLGN